MQTEYKAKLKDGQVEWLGVPPPLSLNGANVLVTLASPSELPTDLPKGERGRRMAEALRELAKLCTFKSISDPVAWQREIREDRKLPFRDE